MSNVKGGAVVTGAARGIGRELALGLLQDGFGVVIADVDPEVGGATVDGLAKEFGGNILFAKADVTKRSEVADAIAACRKAFGGINVMINNGHYA